MAELLYLSRRDVENLLDVDAMLDALGKAFVLLSSGAASVPPRTAARVGTRGLLGSMPGYLADVALEAKLVSVFPANHEAGLDS
ncbi:MAG TPA: ornithine cyclodeaminase family protein, partial [Candidatus Dormibacteraeota bacterium]|nr:ornithine cyclodeaminase family protein [Candidatus Dormibacteraeota bacterium]